MYMSLSLLHSTFLVTAFHLDTSSKTYISLAKTSRSVGGAWDCTLKSKKNGKKIKKVGHWFP